MSVNDNTVSRNDQDNKERSKEPIRRPLSINEMTKEQFDAEIQKGLDDIESGNVYTLEEVEAYMRKILDLKNQFLEGLHMFPMTSWQTADRRKYQVQR
ncbi:MAG: hypothetical protein IJS71_01740 [Clostridia bacterium]|nr:hypothetical protein [Clostridia bacterium]